MTVDAEVVRAAAGSPLGILAQMVAALSTLALAFFRRADVRVRMVVFLALLAGVAGFAGVVMRTSADAGPARPDEAAARSGPTGSDPSARPEDRGNATIVSATGNGSMAIGTVNGNVTRH